MKRLPPLLAHPVVRVVGISILIVSVAALVVMANLGRFTAHSGAQPIAASEAAAILKSGQARSIEVQVDHVYLKTDAARVRLYQGS